MQTSFACMIGLEERVIDERRQGCDGPFDRRPISGARLDDLDLQFFAQDYLANVIDPNDPRNNGCSLAEQLVGLQLASRDGIPNVAGMLLLGREPTAYLPGAYVQFLRIDGTELTDPLVDRKELVGPLPLVLRRCDEIATAHIRMATTIAGTTIEERCFDYPLEAVQQLVRNAATHRSYETSNAPLQWYWFSDRLEIHNPGGLFGRLSEGSFGQPGGNDYRNPTIAGALCVLGFVQRLGLGIPRARKACRENENSEPEFTIGPNGFGVTVRARR